MSPRDVEQLAASARLFGRLLVRELDAATLAELDQADVRRALARVGLEVPDPAQLDELARQWCDCFLHPAGFLPPVHSLHHGGGYDGDPAVAVRRIAAAGALEPAAGARNAPVDHLGCILLLWAELVAARPELARLLAEQHLGWAEAALRPVAEGRARGLGRFYPAVARAALALLPALRSASAEAPAPRGLTGN